MSDLDIIRRIAERGLKFSQEAGSDRGRRYASRAAHDSQIDLWQHLLDELARVNPETPND